MTIKHLFNTASLIVKDKSSRLPLTALCIFILLIPVFLLNRTSRSELNKLNVKHNELSALSGEYKSLRGRLEAFEQKKSHGKAVSAAQALEETLFSLNLKVKLKSVKIIGSREVKGAIEEVAEAVMEKMTMNELVNLFYRLENGPTGLTVRKINIKKSFENPELLNLSMSVALLLEK